MAASKKIYHVAPQAAGNRLEYLFPLDEIVLPKGLACDDCNQYFGEKIEPGIANHPYVQQWRAVYGIGAGKSIHYADENIQIRTSRDGLFALRGEKFKLERTGAITVSQPALNRVDHLQVSRAVHKIALEYELRQVAEREGVECARAAAQKPPLCSIAEYVRRGHRQRYRPYGVEGQGATRVTVSAIRFESDPAKVLVSPPSFTGYIVGLPGARFSCTLSEDTDLLRYMLDRIRVTEAAGFMNTRLVYWKVDSGGISVE